MRTHRSLVVGVFAALTLTAVNAFATEHGAKAGGKGGEKTEAKAAAGKSAAAGAKAGKGMKFVTADQVQFKDVPDKPGISTAQLWGDMSKDGDWGGLFKFKAGTDTGWHTHSGAIHLVMISGTLTIEPEGGQPTELKAGAFADEVAKAKHRTTCGSEDCVFFLHMKSKFDFKLAKEAAAAK